MGTWMSKKQVEARMMMAIAAHEVVSDQAGPLRVGHYSTHRQVGEHGRVPVGAIEVANKKRLDEHERRLQALETKMAALESGVAEIQRAVKVLQSAVFGITHSTGELVTVHSGEFRDSVEETPNV